MADAPATRGGLALALTGIYLIWGSSYLAIHVAVASMPPLATAATRFCCAGALLWAMVRPRCPAPTAAQWRSAAIVGTLLLGVGNGMVCVASQRVPSGVAALVVSTTPLWAVLLPAFAGVRPDARASLGVVLGIAGVAWLRWNPHAAAVGGFDLAMLLLAALSWAAGSLWSRRLPHAPSLWLATAMQMLAGGAITAVASLALEGPQIAAARPTTGSLAALAYLVVVGSIAGFGSYVYLLRHATPAVATSYAYVNPLIAVLLGWALAGERLDAAAGGAAALIVAAVAITLAPRRQARAEAPTAPSKSA